MSEALQEMLWNPTPDSLPTEVQRIQTRHRRILALHMLGWRPAEIAAEVGVTAVTVSRILNSPLVRTRLDGLLDEQDEECKVKNLESQKRREQMLADCIELQYAVVKGSVEYPNPETGEITRQTPNIGQRLRASQDLLDRNAETAKIQRVRDEPPDDTEYQQHVFNIKEKFNTALRERESRVVDIPTTSNPQESPNGHSKPNEGCGPLPDPPSNR